MNRERTQVSLFDHEREHIYLIRSSGVIMSHELTEDSLHLKSQLVGPGSVRVTPTFVAHSEVFPSSVQFSLIFLHLGTPVSRHHSKSRRPMPRISFRSVLFSLGPRRHQNISYLSFHPPFPSPTTVLELSICNKHHLSRL